MRSTARIAPLLALVLALSVTTSPATAEEHPSFDAAMTLMREGRFAEACPKLEEALAVEGTMIVRFRLAECYEQIGKLASALDNYREVAGEAALKSMPDREQFARKKAAELGPRVPKLKVVVPPEVGQNESLQIRIDDEPIARPDWANDTELDLGPHVLTVSGEGYKTWRFEFTLATEREIRTIQIPNQQIAPQSTPAPVPPPKQEESDGMSGQVIGGISLLAGGVVLSAVGIAVGVVAKGNHDDSLADCNADNLCTPGAIAAQEDAVVLGNVATALVVVGAVAAVGGLVLWLVAPSDEGGVAMGVSPTGIAIRGSF